MLFFGPGDFSHAIGAPGRFDDPRLIDARQRVARAAVKAGKFAGTVGMPTPEMLDLGYRFFNIAADVIGLSSYCKTTLAAFEKAVTH